MAMPWDSRRKGFKQGKSPCLLEQGALAAATWQMELCAKAPGPQQPHPLPGFTLAQPGGVDSRGDGGCGFNCRIKLLYQALGRGCL